MFQRKVIQQLTEWKCAPKHRALLLNGARQVGKTTAVRMFAAQNYKNFVEVNFLKTPTAKAAFDGALDTRSIILGLSAMGLGPFVEGETLVFFDEIQECPNARTAIKFLVEEAKFDYIESGSLLGINYKDIPSYPVGFEDEVMVYPFDFEEFLWAVGVDMEVVALIKDCFINKTPVPAAIHEQISRLWRQYLVVGGMPDVVRTFVENDDFNKVVKVQRSIINTYRADIAKYAGSDRIIARRILDAIPSELGKQDKRFVLANLEKGASRRKYENPTQWIVDAGLAYYSFNTKVFELPFEASENRSLFKLYLVDTGLMSSMLLRNIQLQVMNGEISVNEGALVENYVACELASKGLPLNYYDRKSRQELDFVISNNGKIDIIEVKSGTDYHSHASLDAAMNSFSNLIGQSIVLAPCNTEQRGDITYYPLYMSFLLYATFKL